MMYVYDHAVIDGKPEKNKKYLTKYELFSPSTVVRRVVKKKTKAKITVTMYACSLQVRRPSACINVTCECIPITRQNIRTYCVCVKINRRPAVILTYRFTTLTYLYCTYSVQSKRLHGPWLGKRLMSAANFLRAVLEKCNSFEGGR